MMWCITIVEADLTISSLCIDQHPTVWLLRRAGSGIGILWHAEVPVHHERFFEVSSRFPPLRKVGELLDISAKLGELGELDPRVAALRRLGMCGRLTGRRAPKDQCLLAHEHEGACDPLEDPD